MSWRTASSEGSARFGRFPQDLRGPARSASSARPARSARSVRSVRSTMSREIREIHEIREVPREPRDPRDPRRDPRDPRDPRAETQIYQSLADELHEAQISFNLVSVSSLICIPSDYCCRKRSTREQADCQSERRYMRKHMCSSTGFLFSPSIDMRGPSTKPDPDTHF